MDTGRPRGEREPPPHGRRWPARRGLGAVVLAVLLAACVGTWKNISPAAHHRIDPIEGAGEFVGSATCLECHGSFDEHRVESGTHSNCESCHGPGELHAHTTSADSIRFPTSSECAGCHVRGRDSLMDWERSPHERAEVICSDCHDTHNREPLHVRPAKDVELSLLRSSMPSTQLCASCHPAVVSELGLPSHHPVREGMVQCTDCHPAHGPTREILGAATQTCGTCHQEVMGPWVFEHPPVNEDCGFCHAPHGTTADDLLEVNQPAACISCHTLAESGAVHDPWAFSTQCTDCHNAVHGSYTDPHLRR